MYTPDKKVIEKYADVLVNFALNGGKGIKKGETVFLLGPESSKPLFMACIDAIAKSGGNVICNYLPDNADRFGMGREFLTSASSKQLDFFPENFMKGLVADMDHYLYIYCESDPRALQGVDAKKISRRQAAMGPFMKMRDEKERAGKFSWTIGLYPTEGMANEAGLTLEEYWEQVIQACFLDSVDPSAEWRKIYKTNYAVRDKLNKLSVNIDKLHVFGEDADLWVKLGDKRKWVTASGRNIPSFEIYTSPDWRGTEGWVKFNQPLFRTGNRVEGIKLVFKKGKIVEATATKGEDVLKEMIATKNADKIGEYSLTDKRTSRITKFMANTLYDENVGGEFGNTHLAVGKSYYFDAYAGDNKKMNQKKYEDLGFNFSSVHTDMMSTTNRTVIAHMKDGSTKVIYKDGMFQV
jgi:aminopeptidase